MSTKEEIKSNFEAGDVPTEQDFADLVDSQVGVLDAQADLPVAAVGNVGVCYLVGGDTIYRCEESSGVYSWVAYPFTLAAVNNYLNLTNKPAINGHTLGKTNSLNDIGAAAANHTHLYAGSDSVGGAAKKVENKLYISVQGSPITQYDGMKEESINVTFDKIAANVNELSEMSVTSMDDADFIVLYRESEGSAYRVTLADLKTYLNS